MLARRPRLDSSLADDRAADPRETNVAFPDRVGLSLASTSLDQQLMLRTVERDAREEMEREQSIGSRRVTFAFHHYGRDVRQQARPNPKRAHDHASRVPCARQTSQLNRFIREA